MFYSWKALIGIYNEQNCKKKSNKIIFYFVRLFASTVKVTSSDLLMYGNYSYVFIS